MVFIVNYSCCLNTKGKDQSIILFIYAFALNLTVKQHVTD